MNFDFIMMPVAYVLRFCNKIVGNQYILSLLIFAVLIEILLIPFGIKQQKNSVKQELSGKAEEAPVKDNNLIK